MSKKKRKNNAAKASQHKTHVTRSTDQKCAYQGEHNRGEQQQPAADPEKSDMIKRLGKVFRHLTIERIGLVVAVGLLLATWYQGYIARETMRIGSRAFITLAQIKFDCPLCGPEGLKPPTHAGYGASVHAFFVNNGKSPAYVIDENLTIKGTNELLPENFSYPEEPYRDNFEPRGLSIQANPALPLEVTRPIGHMLIRMARGEVPVEGQGKRLPTFIYIYGHLTYRDIFKIQHRLLFCAQYRPPSEEYKEDAWNACPKHNEPDY